jgi:hypothetical protein
MGWILLRAECEFNRKFNGNGNGKFNGDGEPDGVEGAASYGSGV